MKVLHLIGGEDYGGAKSHVISLVNELKKNIDVKLVTFRKGAFAEDAEKLGIDIEVVKTNSFVGDIRKVINIIKTQNISLIHSHGAKANMFSAIIRLLTKIPTVSTVHSDYHLDYLDNKLKKYTYGLINVMALRFIDYRIGVSQNFKNMLIQRNFNPEKIFKLYNGIQFDFNSTKYSRQEFLKKFNLNIPQDSLIVGILARLHPVKGIDVFLDAAEIIAKKHPNTIFVIGGDGDEKKLLLEKASKLGILQNTHFIGYVPDPYEFMECIDINTLTSRSESFPYVILEGANQHKTVVSANVGGISDLIVNGINGFLFEPGDHKKLAEYVIELIESPKLRQQLGEQLYLDAKTNFSLDNMRKTQLNIYSEIFEKIESEKTSKNSYDVILSGYYGFDNLGDDAMLLGIINSLKEYKKHIKILILSKDPIATRLKFAYNSINRIDLLRILYFMQKGTLFINGGGNLIQDNTSSRSLMYYLATLWLAKKFGMKVMIYGNGIGPLKKYIDQKISGFILNQVDVITLREKLSLDVLKKIKVTKPRIELTADPALTIELDDTKTAENILYVEGLTNVKNLVGFSIRKWPGDKHLGEVFAKIADHIAEKYNAVPVFIPMHFPNDVQTAHLIASKMKQKSYVIANKYSIHDILALFKKLEVLVGMRLHSLIFGVKVGIPVIGISYEPKVKGFLELINQDDSIDIENLNYDDFIKSFDNVWQNRSKISAQICENSKHVTALALNNSKYVRELLESGEKKRELK